MWLTFKTDIDLDLLPFTHNQQSDDTLGNILYALYKISMFSLTRCVN